MSRLRIPLALATSVVALLSTSASRAQETSNQTTTTTTSPATTTAPAPQVQVVQPQPAQPQVATTQTTAAPYAPASEDRERTIEHRPNRTLLSTGAGIFILSYGSSVVAGAVSDRDADKRLFIPVVGPWMDLSDRGCSGSSPCGANEDVAKAMVITSGVVQGAGVLLALSSLIIPESTSVTDRTRTAKATERKVHVLPVSFAAGAGVGAVGRF